MKILVTGVYGFLGFHLANTLVDSHEVFGLYNKNTKMGLDKCIKVFSDLTYLEFQPDIVVMCHAAVASGNTHLSNEIVEQNNVVQTQTILNFFSKSRFIYISTVAVYGSPNIIVSENTPVKPETNYAISKLKAEEIVQKKSNYSLIRLSSLYGIGMKENTLIPNYCVQALSENLIKVWGTGARLQNYIHISDAIALILAVIKSNKNFDFPILGVSNKEYTNKEVASMIAINTGAKIEFIGEDLSKSSQYNNNFSKITLNWQPKKELESGITEYLVWKKKTVLIRQG